MTSRREFIKSTHCPMSLIIFFCLRIPMELSFLPSLKQLTLEGNPLKGVRVDILQRGSVELLKYLRSQHAVSPVNPKESPVNAAAMTRKSGGSASIPDESELTVDVHKLKSSGHLNITSRKFKELPDHVFVKAAEAKVGKITLSQNLLSSLPSS